jgi:hypothetical protein
MSLYIRNICLLSVIFMLGTAYAAALPVEVPRTGLIQQPLIHYHPVPSADIQNAPPVASADVTASFNAIDNLLNELNLINADISL